MPKYTRQPRSGAIAVNGQSQPLAAVVDNGMTFQNQSNDVLYLAFGRDATMDNESLRVPAGAIYETTFVSGDDVHVIGPTSGQLFFCEVW